MKCPGGSITSWSTSDVGHCLVAWQRHPDVYHGQSGPFWNEKIARNRARDATVNARLLDEGWTVLRFWDFDVEREPEMCAAAV